MRINPNSVKFIILLAAMNAMGALAVDMTLPATKQMAEGLGISAADTGLNLSVFMIGFALSPLAYGPLSDRFGRKPVIIFSTAIYVLANIGCLFAPSLATLLCWRLLAGIGGGAARPVALAMIRDLFEGAAARGKVSYLASIGILAPLTAPTLGSLLLSVAPWRGIYAALVIFSAALLVIVVVGLQETLRPERRSSLHVGVVARNYLEVFRSRHFLGYAAINSAAFGLIFGYVTGSPLIALNFLGLTPFEFGLSFALTASGIMAGAIINARLNAAHVPPKRLLSVGLILSLCGTFSLLTLALTQHVTLPSLLITVFISTFSCGLITGNASQLALAPFPHIAGAAGALLTAAQVGWGACSGALVAAFSSYASPTCTAVIMAGNALCAGLVYFYFARHTKPGRPREGSPATPR